MRIAQIVLPGASEYERKSQRADYAVLAGKADVAVMTAEEAAQSGASVAHVYASGEISASAFAGFSLPYVASADVRKSRLSFRALAPPALVVSPLAQTEGRTLLLPEVVEEWYFENPVPPKDRMATPPRRSEEHTSELQSQSNLVCRLLLEKKKKKKHKELNPNRTAPIQRMLEDPGHCDLQHAHTYPPSDRDENAHSHQSHADVIHLHHLHS